MAIKCYITNLFAPITRRFVSGIGMVGQPVMKNNSRGNADGKYDQYGDCCNFFYDKASIQNLIFATMLQIYNL
jgi:hypothetical protein